MLEDRDEIDKLFDKDEIIEMWMEETSKEKGIRGLISTENYDENFRLKVYFIKNFDII
ncbi:hypothetical protein [Crassaminicella profunda]|uniref:hypothetical protein n=1 Tax=Crassaminicella profunda TaxID=1286698 RepID=UPI001CA74C6F|nr:hypothetical protein [Crassaminicella profunda]QZY54968.1 hypothetical protein K7H06_18430 [Crassaminicella profunda]